MDSSSGQLPQWFDDTCDSASFTRTGAIPDLPSSCAEMNPRPCHEDDSNSAAPRPEIEIVFQERQIRRPRNRNDRPLSKESIVLPNFSNTEDTATGTSATILPSQTNLTNTTHITSPLSTLDETSASPLRHDDATLSSLGSSHNTTTRQRRKALSASELIKAWQASPPMTPVKAPATPENQLQTSIPLRKSSSHSTLRNSFYATPNRTNSKSPNSSHPLHQSSHRPHSRTLQRTHSMKRRHRRKKSSSASAIIHAWQQGDLPTTPTTMSNIRKTLNAALPTINPKEPVIIDPIYRTDTITPIDLELLRSLEEDYSAAAQLSTVQSQARRMWARRAGVMSIFFMIFYFVVGVLVFLDLADGLEEWTTLDTLLFSVYTATSAGFGHLTPPETSAYYIFNTIYLMVGVAAMAVMIAQVFQWMELEATRANDRRRARQLARMSGAAAGNQPYTDPVEAMADRCLTFFQETPMGNFLSVFLSLSFVTLMGAIPIGILEGWTVWQSLNFGAVAMTTVGYGDLVPETRTGKGLCLIWLPFNVLFSSIYMGSVARWYLNLSARNIQRIQKGLQRYGVEHRDNIGQSLSAVPQATKRIDNSLVNAMNSEDGSIASDEGLVASIGNSDGEGFEVGSFDQEQPRTVLIENISSTLTTMNDIIEVVHKNTDKKEKPARRDGELEDSMNMLSLQEDEMNKPSLALRVLVKERMACIIALEICGGSHYVDVKDTFIVVKVGQWKEVVKKWVIPSGAWKAFRAAALEVMMLVGERTLLKDGPAALFALCPDEFHSLFSPLVAAMGESSTLDGWLRSTDLLALEWLQYGDFQDPRRLGMRKQHRRLTIEDEIVHIPQSQAAYFKG